MGELKPNKSIITHIEVTFREIDRIFDILPGTLFASGGESGARLVIDAGLCPGSKAFLFQRDAWCDEAGDSAVGVVDVAPGVYRGVRVDGYTPFLQTFHRQRSVVLDRKYVYVYSVKSSAGAAGELKCELYFEKGEFRRIPLDTTQGQDVRAPSGAKSRRLLLDLISARDAEQTEEVYYFFLAPYQLPWAAVEELTHCIQIRGVRLWDFYYTDIYISTDADSATAVTHAMLQRKSIGATMMFSVHLPDPFKEALGRAQRFANMLRKWEPEQARLGAEREYMLAMRIVNFANRNPDFADSVDVSKAMSFMRNLDREATKLFMFSSLRCNELLRWIGAAQRLDSAPYPAINPHAEHHTWVVEGKRFIGLKEDRLNDGWRNAFSNACDDYALAAPNIVDEVAQIVYRVHEDLQLCAVGASWLSKNFDNITSTLIAADSSWSKVERERPSLAQAHGGASILFPAKRKFFQGGGEYSAGLLRFYSRRWVQRYRDKALDGVANFLKYVHHINIEAVQSTGERFLLKERAGRQLRRLRKHPRRFKGEPSSVHVLKLNSAAFPFVALAVEYVNFDAALDQWNGDRTNLYNSVNFAGAIIDSYVAIAAVVKKLPNPEIALYKVGTRVAKFSPLAVASAAVDVTTASIDLATARTSDEGVAHGFRVVGATLCLGGTFVAETPPGWILMVAGLVIQGAGTYVVANLSATSRYLRYCRWGKGGAVLSGDLRDEQDEYWYTGKLSCLANDIEEQHKALDRLMYDFDPKLSVEREGPDFVLCAQMRDDKAAQSETNLIGPEAGWSVTAELYRPDFGENPLKKVSFDADACDTFDLTVGGKIPLHTFQWPSRSLLLPPPYPTIGPMPSERPPQWDMPEGSVSVKAEIVLDVFGDGTCVVTRKWEDSVNFLFH